MFKLVLLAGWLWASVWATNRRSLRSSNGSEGWSINGRCRDLVANRHVYYQRPISSISPAFWSRSTLRFEIVEATGFPSRFGQIPTTRQKKPTETYGTIFIQRGHRVCKGDHVIISRCYPLNPLGVQVGLPPLIARWPKTTPTIKNLALVKATLVT